MRQELESLKSEARTGESTVYGVTTGRGRKSKAHILDSEGESLCSAARSRLKKLDAATVEEFYSVCQRCLRVRDTDTE